MLQGPELTPTGNGEGDGGDGDDGGGGRDGDDGDGAAGGGAGHGESGVTVSTQLTSGTLGIQSLDCGLWIFFFFFEN